PDVGDRPLAQELLGRQVWLIVGSERVVERVEVVVEHHARRAEGVLLLEVEQVRDAVEHEHVIDHGGSPLAGMWAAREPAGSGTWAGGGRNRSSRAALSDSRSVVHASSQTISTSASVTPGCASSRSWTSVSTRDANGHQPEVSSNSTRTWPLQESTERTRPMSTTEIPFSRQHGSYTSLSASRAHCGTWDMQPSSACRAGRRKPPIFHILNGYRGRPACSPAAPRAAS